MNLNKKTLIKALEKGLKDQHFIAFEDSFFGVSKLFIKIIKPNLFLTLGLETSRFEKDIFTGSFYLSKTTCWSCIWGDIPKESFKRIGALLSKTEKANFLGDDFEATVEDSWWNSNNTDVFNDFLEAIQTAEINFIIPELVDEINRSKDAIDLYELSMKVISMIRNKEIIEDLDLKFVPEKEIDNIPKKWFNAAEIVLRNNNEVINKNRVRLLASDAYRMNVLS